MRLNKPRILFCASYSAIEPLGLLYLAGLARDEGYDRRFHLVKDHDFESFFDDIDDFRPDYVGFNLYTGNHYQVFHAFRRLKRSHPTIQTIVGGPHATYFPVDASNQADFVVMSEGFSALRQILQGNTQPGISPPGPSESFPHPDRETFYRQYPEHAKSKIKSVITMTGCPYTCTYCYNSSTSAEIKHNLTSDLATRMAQFLSKNGRLFPNNVRSFDSVLQETKEISEKWPAEVIYFQDDVFGFDIKENGFLENMAKTWPREVGVPYHAQMRWEMTKQQKRLDLIQESGGFGLTLAIESSIPEIRRHVLDRPMADELIFNGMQSVIDRGLKIRTEQITGLPYGATPTPTPMNLDADLHLLEHNVQLREATNGPTMAWASTLAPYVGTKLATYCRDNGHYYSNPGEQNHDVPDTFFERSVLRFPKEWIGPTLMDKKTDTSIWLSEEDLELYRDRNAELRRKFNFFAGIPKGHLLASNYLRSDKPYSYKRLGEETKQHLKMLARKGYSQALKMLDSVHHIEQVVSVTDTGLKDSDLQTQLEQLVYYFAGLPNGASALNRTIDYSWKYGRGKLTPNILSDATRHSLYEDVLYSVTTNTNTN